MQKGTDLGGKDGVEKEASGGGVQDDKCICAREWRAGT